MKAGDTRPGRAGSGSDSECASEDSSCESIERSDKEREFKSSSEMARETGIGRGE